MKKVLIIALLLWCFDGFSQQVEMQLFVRNFTPASTQLGLRIRSKAGVVPFLGATFYVLYQSTNASPVSFDDARMVTGYGWATSNRFFNPNQVVNIAAGGRTYDRRYVYGNVDETAGSFVINLTTAWDTVLYLNFNNLQASAPQGGYAFAQETSEPGAGGVALTDVGFANIAIDVTTSSVPLQAVPLPVSLTRFDAQCQPNRTVAVTWSTASEQNNASFEVEKSRNGVDWKSINRVATSSANSTGNKNYQVTDPEGGAAQYRLKQTDRDGKVTYSATVRTSCEGRNVYVTLFPVPARDVINLVVGTETGVKTNLQVYDSRGRMVLNKPVTLTSGQNSLQLAVHQLAAGEYLLKSSNPALDINKRFSIIR